MLKSLTAFFVINIDNFLIERITLLPMVQSHLNLRWRAQVHFSHNNLSAAFDGLFG